ncbi:MAG: hypothetical protein QGG40_16790, partial [Myxococcota bacterium]|nr:hypothetical protein [Myxococcota bacterium]
MGQEIENVVDESLAPEVRDVTSGEPVNPGTIPVFPETGDVRWGADPVSTSRYDHPAVAWHQRLALEWTVDRIQLSSRVQG